MKHAFRFLSFILPLLLITPGVLASTSVSDIVVSDVKKIPRYGQFWVTGKVKNAGDTPAVVRLKVVARDQYDMAVEAREFWPNGQKPIPPGEIVTFGHYVQKDDKIVRVDVKVKGVKNQKATRSKAKKKRFWFF